LPQLTVATFNIHAGVDGWGTPFDVVGCCGRLDADVLLLQETWTPACGQGIVALVAASLGYEAHQVRLADALLLEPAHAARARWGPRNSHQNRSLWVGDARDLEHVGSQHSGEARAGTWGIALLSRLPVRRVETVALARLRRDSAERRSAILAEIEVGRSSVTVVGTHLAHLTHGSPLLLERLRHKLPASGQAAVLAGDMNFWGPPLSLALPGWRRAVKARTYPSWRAHSQIDHIFVTRAVEVISGASLAVGNSDHLPLRAQLAVA